MSGDDQPDLLSDMSDLDFVRHLLCWPTYMTTCPRRSVVSECLLISAARWGDPAR